MTIKQILLAGVVSILPMAAVSDPFTDAERAQITTLVQTVQPAIMSGDFAASLKAMPPNIIRVLAEAAGTSEETLFDGFVAQMELAMADATITSYTFDLDATTYHETAGGRPYALIPTQMVLQVEGTLAKVDAMTIALTEDGAAYLALLDEPAQLGLFLTAYPDFSEIDVPAGTMEIIE